MRLTKELISNIRYTLKEYMRDKLLKDAIIKAPHDYFGVTEEEFCNTLNILIKNKYKGHEQFLTEVLQLKPDGYSISINGSYYHVYSDFGVRFGFKDLAPKEAEEYFSYAAKTESLYAKRKELYDKFYAESGVEQQMEAKKLQKFIDNQMKELNIKISYK